MIALDVERLPFADEVLVTHYRIDGEHSNAYAEWVRQGKPMYPTAEQRATLKAREGLETLGPPQIARLNAGKISLEFQLPVHGVSMLVVSTR